MKPGATTTEFWLTILATMLGTTLEVFGMFEDEWSRVAAFVCGALIQTLSIMGYQQARAKVKGDEAQAFACARMGQPSNGAVMRLKKEPLDAPTASVT